MPWHDPICRKCRIGKGRKQKKEATNPEKWAYKCDWCGHEFEDWKHNEPKTRPKP